MKPEETVGKFVTYDGDDGSVWMHIKNHYKLNDKNWLTGRMVLKRGDSITVFSDQRSLNFENLIKINARFFTLTDDIVEEIDDFAMLSFLGAKPSKAMELGAEYMMREYKSNSINNL